MNSVSKTAKINENVKIGCYTVIEDDVVIGSNVSIGNSVTIYSGTRIGDNVIIESNSVIGRQPRPAKTSTLKISQPMAALEIGSDTTVGAGAVLYAGTVIGSGCLIGDTAVVRESCTIGDNVIVGTGTIVENSVNVGQGTKIQSGSYITAYTTIGQNCFIAPMVTTTNDNFMGRTEERFKLIKGAVIEKGARVGGGSILLPGVTIHEESFIAAGSVVTRDTEPGKVYKGVPAREFRSVPENELLKGDEKQMIPLMDLKAQYLSLQDEIKEAIGNVLSSGHYILGPNVQCLEEEIADYCGAKYAVGVASGTDALVLCLKAYGIGTGDEVITTPYSFFATAEAISRVGATPVFADIDESSYNIYVDSIESSITVNTKAIIPVHLFGQPALMDEIVELANRYHLIVIEDACQAMGASYKGRKVGTLGNAACFSFFPTKNLGGYGDGGMITTNDEDLAGRIRLLRSHGSSEKYYNRMIGYNSRLDEIQAAILRVKLKRLDRWNAARRAKAERYRDLLQGLPLKLPEASKGAEHIYHLYIVRHQKREEIVKGLKNAQIGCGVYYPVPLHRQKAYRELYSSLSLPVAEAASKETFAIPLYPEMTDDQLAYVAEELRRILQDIQRRSS